MTGAVKMNPKAQLPPPSAEQLADALQRARPGLVAAVEPMDEGWAFHTYRARDCVLRFPKRAKYVETVVAEARIVQELAPVSPLLISAIEVHADGPNGLPFTSHRYLPGVRASGPLTSDAAYSLGAFLRAVHSYPAERARELGLHYHDAAHGRSDGAGLYEQVIRRAFPLVSCEARQYLEAGFEAYLNDDVNFAWEPTLLHGDINPRNVLVDPATSEITGIIDFGCSIVGDPAFDFADPLLGDLLKGGTDGQVEALERGYGRPLAPMLPRCRFFAFCWPIYHILEGLEADDAEFTADGIRMVNAAVPRDLRCD